MSNAPDLPSTSELVEGVLFYPIALVISATIFPGLTLCIPGLIFVAALILIPLVAMAIVVLLTAAVFAAPVLLVRAIRGRDRRRSAAKPRIAVADVPATRLAPAVYFGRPSLASAASAHMAPREALHSV